MYLWAHKHSSSSSSDERESGMKLLCMPPKIAYMHTMCVRLRIFFSYLLSRVCVFVCVQTCFFVRFLSLPLPLSLAWLSFCFSKNRLLNSRTRICNMYDIFVTTANLANLSVLFCFSIVCVHGVRYLYEAETKQNETKCNSFRKQFHCLVHICRVFAMIVIIK